MKKKLAAIFIPVALVAGLGVGLLIYQLTKNPNSNNSQDTPSNNDDDPKTGIKTISKEDFLKTIDNAKNEENITINIAADMKGQEDEPGNFTGLLMGNSLKIDGKKTETYVSLGMIQEYTEDYFEYIYNESGATTKEEKDEIYLSILGSLEMMGSEVVEQKENYILGKLVLEDGSRYGEKIQDDDTFMYDYESTGLGNETYFKSKVFISDSESFDLHSIDNLISPFIAEEVYDGLVFDETSKKYFSNDINLIGSLDESAPDEEDIVSFSISYDFLDKEILSISLEYTTEDSITTFVISFERGTTDIVLPSSIIECDHEDVTSIFDNYGDGYHFARCLDCDCVLRYEEHTYTNGICLKCGHIENNEGIQKDIDLGSEHMSSHFRCFETADGTVVSLNVTGVTYDYDYDKEVYVHRCANDECDLRIERCSTEEHNETNPCLIGEVSTYKFYHGEAETPFYEYTGTINSVNHHFDETNVPDPENPCKFICTKKCTVCGLTDTYEECSHDYEEIYSSNGCKLVFTEKCKDCNKEQKVEKVVHKELVIGDADGDRYQCHCNACNEDFVYTLDIDDYTGFKGHDVYRYYGGGDGLMPHEYGEDGKCVLCGYDKSEDEYKAIWIYCAYEGKDYIVVSVDSEGKFNQILYGDKFIYVEDEITGEGKYVSSYSDYVIEVVTDEITSEIHYVVKKGSTIIATLKYDEVVTLN